MRSLIYFVPFSQFALKFARISQLYFHSSLGKVPFVTVVKEKDFESMLCLVEMSFIRPHALVVKDSVGFFMCYGLCISQDGTPP